eukprot:jgi/Orpsp1_1/1174988/evm.model.c7180000052222.1
MSEENNEDIVAFPSKWDQESLGAVDFYNRCSHVVDKEEDFYEIIKTSSFYYVFACSVVAFVIIINIGLFYYYNSYVFKRQCRIYYIGLLVGGLIMIMDSFLLGVFYESYPCSVHHALTGLCYFLESTQTKIVCSKIVQYAPPGIFVLFSVITSTILLSLSMLNDIIHLSKCNKKLKSTYKGMLELLEDRIQFREFGEFCRNENCVENILFYQEYWKYKKLFNKGDRFSVTDPLKSQEMIDSPSMTTSRITENNISRATGINDNNDRVSAVVASTIISDSTKLTKASLETIEKEAKKFTESFIGSKAIYEINIQHFIITSIIDKLESLQDDQEQSVEEKVEEYYTIFDRAYKEVTNNIYLNSYSNYVHKKNKEVKDGNKDRGSKTASMC